MRYEELESLLIYIWPAGVHAKPFNHILCFTRTADSKNLYATYEDYDFMGYRKTLIHFILLAPRPSGMSLADMGPVQMRLAIPKLAWPSKAEFLCPLSKVFFSLEKWNPEYRCDALELLIGQQARLKYWHTGLSILVERAIMKNHEKKHPFSSTQIKQEGKVHALFAHSYCLWAVCSPFSLSKSPGMWW